MLIGQLVLFDVLEIPIQESFYNGELLITNFFVFGWKRIIAILGLVAITGLLTYFHPVHWKHVDPLPRYVILTLLLIQTYAITFLEYNHYHDKWFWADRILLAVLAIYTAFNPYALVIYLVELVLLVGQLEFPSVIGYDHTHKSLVMPLLISFWVFLVIHRLSGRRVKWPLYTLFIFSLLASWYLQAGIAKVKLNWQTDNNLYNMLAASVDAGWLHNLSEIALQSVATLVQENYLLLQYGGLAVELIFPLLLVINRRIAIFCFINFIIFHLMVYVVSGIFFWQWIIMETVIIAVLLYRPQSTAVLFTRPYWALFALLLILNPLFIHITPLAWLDCGFINSYTFYLRNDTGEKQRLDSSFFSPYDVGFAKNRFTYTNPDNVVAKTLGQCHDAQVVQLVEQWSENSEADNREKVRNYKAEFGMNNYNEQRAEKFRRFLTEFTQNKLRYDPQFISQVDVPIHMQQGKNQQNFSFDEANQLIIVYEEKVVRPDLKFFSLKTDSVRMDVSPQQAVR
ncbi:hypothetical protein [Tunicatimonas pelagia]|uniref:hypothetical protein n=1 Tax=Tunicatimonas pelagia TaxID=931531 RepID=UPI002665CCCF|nr:hypothetical protein [Tunicatimonas pelagia]WKN41786.1 hypothetical protein P0M28_22365 [Tunicatimonas pelagia]